MKTATTRDKISNLLRRRLRRIRLRGGVEVHLGGGEIKKRHGWWYVPVRLSAEPTNVLEFVDALVELEMDLSEKHRLDVWLVPDVAD
jgi:hypothetical protein